MLFYHHKENFELEAGGALAEITVAYNTWGALNKNGDNVIWICHALTANSNAEEWWPNMIGEGLAFDTSRYFIVCANILGSCYGTTGPLSIDPGTNSPYYHQFPFITIRDMVQAHELLRNHLGISVIHLLVGSSMGGYQALEWAIMKPLIFKNLLLLATSAKETPWGIAIHTAQRMAIETDTTWKDNNSRAGSQGLQVARSIGMLTYRSYETFLATQAETDNNKLDGFKASSYVRYQGEKFANRFNAFSYYVLSKAMDSHNIARDRISVEEALQQITANTLVIGIETDVLCPLAEQHFLAQHIPASNLVIIKSIYGHDGFLVETTQISAHLLNWLSTT